MAGPGPLRCMPALQTADGPSPRARRNRDVSAMARRQGCFCHHCCGSGRCRGQISFIDSVSYIRPLIIT